MVAVSNVLLTIPDAVSVDGQGHLGSEDLVYGGFGAYTLVASGSAGVVGFSSGGIGVYGEGFLFGRGGGVGAYVNLKTNAGCE